MASVALAFDVLARDRASRTFDNIGGSVERTGGKLSRLGGGFASFAKTAGLALGGVAVAAGVMGKGFIDAATESQKVTKQTEAVIKSMGGASNVTAQQVADLSEQLSMKSGVDDELIQSGQNVLLTFGKIRNETGKGNKIFDRATKAALNMSVALGTDLQSANIQVGKALNDPIKGITALSRAGVSFSQKQKDTIKRLTETGDVLGAQKIILGELDKQFGGSAEAQATAGEKLKVVWGNFQEQMGERLLPVVEKVAGFLADKLPVAMDTVGRFLTPLTDQIGLFWGALTTGMTEDEGTTIERFALFLRDVIPQAAAAVKGFAEDALAALSDWWDDNGDNVINFLGDLGGVAQTAAGFLGDVATVIQDEVLPRLWDFAGFIGDNDAAFDIFRGTILALAGAWLYYSFAAGVAALATLGPMAPFLLLAGVVVGLTVLTQALADAFDDQLNVALQWLVDRAGDILGFFSDLLDLAVRALAAVEALKQTLPDLNLPGTGDGGLLPSIPIPLPGPVDDIWNGLFHGDNGGVIPGRRGTPQLVVGHGGETMVPTHKTGTFDALGEDQLVELRRQNAILASIDSRLGRPFGVTSWRGAAAVM